MACAACKYMGEDCVDNCPFSPYFSPDEPDKFASVDRVFGKVQFCKLVRGVPVEKRAEAANSLVYEATLRMNHPVSGCRGAIEALDHRVNFLETRLNAISVCVRLLSDTSILPPLPPRPPLRPNPIPRTDTPPTPPVSVSTSSTGAPDNST